MRPILQQKVYDGIVASEAALIREPLVLIFNIYRQIPLDVWWGSAEG